MIEQDFLANLVNQILNLIKINLNLAQKINQLVNDDC